MPEAAQATPDSQTLETLLVAADFSETAGVALEWAEELARCHGARLVLFHALAPPLPPTPAPEFVALPAELYEELRDSALKQLDRTAEPLRGRGLLVDTDLAVGPSAPTVLEAAKRWDADLVVAGTRGHTGFRRLLLGSTASRLVQGASCPVFTVHPEDAGRHRPVRTVIVPTDFSEDAEFAAQAALRILGPVFSEARLILLHAYHLPIEFASLGPPPVLPEAFAAAGDAATRRLEEIAKPLRARGLRVDVMVREGYPPAVIEEEAKAARADLVAMGTHGRSGLKHLLLGSTAERVLPHAPCPVLTVRRPGKD